MNPFGTATCPVCHVTFPRAVPHQIYDRFICSRKASRARWKARSQTGEPATETPAHVRSIVNPTDEVLVICAIHFRQNHRAKPIIFSGNFNRQWQPPEGIMFVEDESGGMIMAHEELFSSEQNLNTEQHIS
jgi:hypothetical protein